MSETTDPTAGEPTVTVHDEPGGVVYVGGGASYALEPDAGDVEALTEAERLQLLNGPKRDDETERDRLARVAAEIAAVRVDAVRRKAGADALTEAADEFASITGDNTVAVQTWHAAADDLRARIARESR